MPDTLELARLFDHFVDEGQSAFSVGVLGAIAEFERTPDEPAQRLPAGIVTPRGGLALSPDSAARISDAPTGPSACSSAASEGVAESQLAATRERVIFRVESGIYG